MGGLPERRPVARLVTAMIVETHDEWAVAEGSYLSETSGAPAPVRGGPAQGGTEAATTGGVSP